MSSDTSLAGPAPRPASGNLSIRSHLLLLIAGILVPMLALVALLAWNYGVAARQAIEAQRLDVAINLTNLIDREIQAIAGFLSGISMSPALQAADPVIFERIAGASRQRGFEVLYLFDAAGRLLLTSPSPPASPAAAAQYAGVAEVAAGLSVHVSGWQAATADRAALFFVSIPIRVGARTELVLAGGLSPQRLQALFAAAGLPADWRSGIVDREGIILARSRSPEMPVGIPAQEAMIEAARSGQRSGLFDVVSRDGVEVRNAFQRSQLSGWTAAVAVPVAIVDEPLWASLRILGAMGLGLTLLGLLLGLLVAHRITRAVRRLGHAVVALASGDDVDLPTNTVTELRDVLRVIESTAAMRRDPGSTPRR